MDQAEFQDWLSASDRLTAAQRAEAARALSTDADEERSVAAVERSVGESRICPRCGIAPSTAFRRRHRFLDASRQDPETLRGIVEADETYLLRSRKGERSMVRPPRRRGGKANARGLSKDLAPVLFAADRSGATLGAALDSTRRVAARPARGRSDCPTSL